MDRQRLPLARRVMTDEFLQKVAQVYRENIDGTPTKTVGEVFNVQPRMASKYVERARQQGFLSPDRPGKEEGMTMSKRQLTTATADQKGRGGRPRTGKTAVRYQLTVDAGRRPETQAGGARSGGDSPPRQPRAPNSPRFRAV